ncbi:hypothetical protein HPB52_009478 [Rhipicephalus sanguineus]|uniref:C2H2-type domain-containing protein n=1 Tax=Rhipicephalus sanguineus TaxID=34632 RepID=A0A9D4T7D5_RHISA|nr:hypothetical protein HPB52_009478 [Rhipicephalus sanguineus]
MGLVEEHSLGLLPLLKQDLIVLESGSRQPPKTSLSRSTPPSEDLRVCSHDDNPLAGSLEASEVGAFEERGAAVDGATLKASAAMFQGAADSEDTCHHGGSEAMIPSVCIGAESCAESHEKGASLFTERVYSSGAGILLERQANYACQFCPYMTKWKASMIHHRRMHKRILPHKCDICGRGYLRQSTLRYHMRTHTDEHPYQCSLCPSTFSCRKSLTEHKSTHTDERPYLCNVCDRAFKTLNALTSHRRTHTETTPGKNNVEGLPQKEQVYVPFADAAHQGTVTSSVNGAALTTALSSFGEFKVVGAEGTVSVTGDKSSRAAEARQGNSAYYVTVSSLGPMNIAEEHSYSSRQGILAVKQPEYACPLCPFKTRHRSAFRPHQLLHTGGKPHQCEVCGQTFRLSYTLRQHMRTHTGERPYRCEVCDRRFSVNNCLRVHMRAHTGERPYQCKLCDKAFVALHGLKNHLSSHSTEKPFHCDGCAKSFPYAAALKYHKAHHCHRQSTGVGTSTCRGSGKYPDAINIVERDHDKGSQGSSIDDKIVQQPSKEF